MDSACYGSSDPTRPLISHNENRSYGVAPALSEAPQATSKQRTIGFWSAVFIIFNRIIGTGIFATPAIVLSLSGSVGLALALWTFGSLYAAAGMQVYIIWGRAFPQNGGEKNYLQYLLPKPAHLVLCLYAASSSLIGWSAANALIFGEYFLKAILGGEPSEILLQLASFACVTITFFLHGMALEWGIRIQNILGVFKLIVMFAVIATGVVALTTGIPSFEDLQNDTSRWRGKENFKNMWQGTTLSTSSICTSLYSVIYSFIGFSNANYALGEMKNPRRTLKIAGHLAVVLAAVLYMLSNIAYLSAASKQEIIDSGRLVVSLLMKNMWGERFERLVDMGVALCAFGGVLAIFFAQGRINQELGKEGVLPLGKFLASNKPFNAPLAGLGLHWILCVLIIFFVPPGDAYNLVINLGSYPLAVINIVISFGLIYLFLSPSSRSGEHSQYHWNLVSPATLAATAFFGAVNTFLAIAPFVPPPPGKEPYQSLPHWTHAVAGCGLFVVGAIWWVVRPQTLSLT